MTIFDAVKSRVTPRVAAERYGLQISRNGMIRCPFHDDTNPSMKLYDDHYHCFGCQETGDVIRLTEISLVFQPRKRRKSWTRTLESKKKRHLCWQS